MPLDLEALTLDKGSHTSPDAGMCVMEAVALMAGETFTDAPSCASPVIRAFMISWNDALPDDERQQLKRHIPALIGTAGTPEQETRRAWMATDWLVRVQAPAWLRLAGLTDQAQILEGMAEAAAQEAMAASLRPLHDRIASPPKLSQGPSLIPVKDILGDRLQFHPSGKVLLQVSPDYSVVFRDETHLDAVLEMVDRERSPGRDPWVPSVIAGYQENVRRLRDEREALR